MTDRDRAEPTSEPRTQSSGRRNPHQIRRYFLGREYRNAKKAHGGERGNQHNLASPQFEDLPKTAEVLAAKHAVGNDNAKQSPQIEGFESPKTAEVLAAKHAVGRATVERAGNFAAAIDTVAENVGVDFRKFPAKLSRGDNVGSSC